MKSNRFADLQLWNASIVGRFAVSIILSAKYKEIHVSGNQPESTKVRLLFNYA